MIKKIIEEKFEGFLWSTRFLTIIAVLFGILSAFALLILGSIDIVTATKPIFLLDFAHVDNKKILINIIGAIDLYLIAIVLLIFSFGVYELFISRIDVGRNNKDNLGILKISTLDQLKSKILKVIIMVLIVTFFKNAFEINYSTPLSMLYFGLAILAISLGSYFIGKKTDK